MKKTHKVFIILTAVILTSFLFIKNYLKPTELVYSGTIKTKEITSPVNVYFDEYGVPSVFAENDETINTVSELKDIVNSSLMTTEEIKEILINPDQKKYVRCLPCCPWRQLQLCISASSAKKLAKRLLRAVSTCLNS